jgi:hypothetical protein
MNLGDGQERIDAVEDGLDRAEPTCEIAVNASRSRTVPVGRIEDIQMMPDRVLQPGETPVVKGCIYGSPLSGHETRQRACCGRQPVGPPDSRVDRTPVST